MTPAPETRDPVRGGGARPSERSLPFEAGSLVLSVIVLGLLLRAFIAALWLPRSGFGVDMGDFTAWAQRLAEAGPGNFYAAGYFSDYPPAYMYVLWAIGVVGNALQPLAGVSVTGGLLKIPPILADGATAWLLFLLGRRFLGERLGDAAGSRIGLVAAVVYLFNPGVIFDSSVWGQVDSVGTLAVVATIYFLLRGWTEAAAVGAILALLLKFQFAFMVPIVLVVGLKRHLAGRSSDPDRDEAPDPLRLLTSLAAGLGSLMVLIVPFGLGLWSPDRNANTLAAKFFEAASTYKGLTVNAFNLWMNPVSGLASPRDPGGLGPSLGWGDDQAVVAAIGSYTVTWQALGIVLFLVVAALATWLIVRRDDAVGVLVATLVVSVAFFALPTRVHERYLFPALAIGALLVLRDRRWAVLYGLISLSFFANVYGVYTADWSFYPRIINPGVGGAAMARDPVLNATLLAPWGIYLVSAMIVLVLGWLLTLAADVARRRPAWQALRLLDAPEAEVSGERWRAGWPSGWADRWRSRPGADDGDRQSIAREAHESGGLRLPGWLRVDRAHPFFRDPPRRLDRLDALLIVAFLLVAFGFRVWRLDIPRSMCCFDEIYHARSAVEFLADWEHGWTRDVYEWTHPMLAKYLIAAGIEIADPNKVASSTTLDGNSRALAVAPPRAALGQQRSIAFIGNGTRVVARDALDGTLVASWPVGQPVASLAYDDDARTLLVGTASGGMISVFDLSGFLSASGERGPPPRTASIATRLASVEQILAPSSGSTYFARGSNGLAAVDRSSHKLIAQSQLVTPAIAFASGDGNLADSVLATLPKDSAVVPLDAGTLQERDGGRITLNAAPLGPIIVQGKGADQQAWVLVGDLPADEEHPATAGGVAVMDAPQLLTTDTVPLPGRADILAWQSSADLVYAGGRDASGAPVVWTINPLGDSRSGFATFDTTPVPGPVTAMSTDVSSHSQSDDDGRLLLTTAVDGGNAAALVGIDGTSDPFAWRLMGIIFGSILVVLIYLLAATMFRRRSIAILAAAYVAFDGMSYVMSRIAMNDIYVAVFIVAAYLLFWQIWSGRWARSAWWALPLVGVLIGLSAATKWVGWYALVGILILVLARSALGRLLLVAAIGFITIVAGIGVPWPFLVVCLLALALALFLVYVRPVRLEAADLMALPASGVVLGGIGVAFAIGYNQVEGRNPQGAVEVLFDFLARGTQAAWPAWLLLAVAAVLIVARAFVSLRDPTSDRRWMRPGELAGFEWPWVGACLVVVPLLVYFVSYIPYLQLGHHISISGGPGYGWSLDELQVQMFSYHFGLTSGHPAASPWWSWPLDLKPVWFYGSPYDWDGRLQANVYNGGNPILFWAGVPALLVCTLLAWRRRSPALVLLIAAFAFQFLPWTRIERATFEYHYLTAVLFAMIAVAYVVDEALRSPIYQSLGVAFLVAAAVVGVLVWPMGSAFPMPDWYVNEAKTIWMWNYNFRFPDPPQGLHSQLIDANPIRLAAGTLVGLLAAVFAIWGRDLFRPGVWPIAAQLGPGAQGRYEQDQAEGDDHERLHLSVTEPRERVTSQEPDAYQDQDRAQDQSTST